MSSIKDIGYMDFFNHPCVCIQDGMDLILVPQKPEDNILPLYFYLYLNTIVSPSLYSEIIFVASSTTIVTVSLNKLSFLRPAKI